MKGNQTMSCRSQLRNDVLKIIASISPKYEVRGSWIDGSFHLEEQSYTSFSDIDIFCDQIDDKRMRQWELQNIIEETTHLKLPVSIHTKNSLGQLTLKNAHDLALLEYTYQIRKENTQRKVNYLKAKFLLYLMRNSKSESYAEIAQRIDHETVRKAFEIKRGSNQSLSQDDMQHMIEVYVEGNKLQGYCKELILPVKPREEVLDRIYKTLMAESKVDDFLKNRIQEKYNSLS